MNKNRKNILLTVILLVLWIVIFIFLKQFSDFITYTLLQLEPGTHLTSAVNFFIYEVPKVMLLLVLIIFAVGIVRSYFSPEKTRDALEGKPLFTGNVLASMLGIVTPFCSCSAIPLFLGFVEAGIPLGVTFSFLIAAPMINEVALVLLFGLFGWKTALIYVVTGLSIAILAGWLLEKLRLQRFVADWVYKTHANNAVEYQHQPAFSDRIHSGYQAVKEIVGKIWPYIIAGIAIGAGAHGYVPDNYLSNLLGNQNGFAVPLAILIGVPLYSNAAGIVPIVSVLIEKGVSLGTALAFMMSVIGLSLPEMIILKKVLKWQLIMVFVGVVAVGIVIVGYIFNYVF